MDIMGMLKQFMDQARGVSQAVRTGNPGLVAKCALPGCGTVTAGARCEKCSRALCIQHTFFRVEMPVSLKGYCPYCVLALNPGLFRDGDDDEENDANSGSPGDEPIDAEYERE